MNRGKQLVRATGEHLALSRLSAKGILVFQTMRGKRKHFISIVAMISLCIAIYPSSASRVVGDRPYFTSKPTSPLELLDKYPENKLVNPLDERIGTASYNNTSGKGVLLRAIPNLFSDIPFSSHILARNAKSTTDPNWYRCDSLTASDCKGATEVSLDITFEPCWSVSQTDCISRFAVQKNSGEIQEAVPLTPIFSSVKGEDYTSLNFSGVKGSLKNNLPSGGEPYLWTFPSLEHRGGKLFLPLVKVSDFSGIYGITDIANYKFSDLNFHLGVMPYSPTLDKTYTPQKIAQPSYNLLPDAFLSDDAFFIEFRSSVPWTSWVRSTVTGLEIKSSKSGSDFVYFVSGKPAKVPMVTQLIPWTKDNLEGLRNIDLGGVTVGKQCDNNTKDKPFDCWVPVDVGSKASFDIYFNMFESIERYTDKKSTFNPRKWIVEDVPSFKSLYGTWALSAGAPGAKCIKDYKKNSPMGVTSSNATLATDGPPIWDAKTETLNYRLAALPLLSDGSKFIGHYTLQIPIEVAQCFWGVNASRAQATISVTSEDGKEQVITAIASSNSEYFRFNVQGFHFSSPTIKMKLLTTAANIPSATPTTSVIPKKPVIKKIVCTKGKSVRTVLNTSKCPSGYKVKK